MDFSVKPLNRVTLPIRGVDAAFPVGTVYCIGRNYAAHAREMGHDPDRELPFFFLKATSCISTGPTFAYPRLSDDVHHEIELVAALGRGGVNLSEDDAMACVFGFGVGLDMTRRDRQSEAKAQGRPWDVGKTFAQAAPCSEIVPVDACVLRDDSEISLRVNGGLRQSGRLNQMIWSLREQIAILSRAFDLEAGDLIFTGTPAGVGPVHPGDQLEGCVEGVGALKLTVV